MKLILFFEILFNNVFIVSIKNLHQSRAGIGNKFNIHKLTEIIAVIILKNIIHAQILLLIKSTIQIGQLICSNASFLSSVFFGLNIFFQIIPNHFIVNTD